MAKLTDDQIKNAALEQINDSEGYDGGELSSVRENALAYYFLKESAAPSVPGRSAVQSSDVADMVEALTAQIMPAFAMENIVEFDALDDDDVDQAARETEAVSFVVMSQNNGFYEIQNAVKDALLMRNGIIKVFLDTREETGRENYPRLTTLEYGELVMASVDNLDAVDNGVQITSHQEEDGFHQVSVKTKKTTREVCVKSIDPLNCSWDRDWDSIYLKDCPFFSEYALVTRSDLVEMGFSKSQVAEVSTGGQGNTSRQARNNNTTTKPLSGAEPSQDLIDYYECYMRIDVDGDGIAELVKVSIAGQTLLEWEEVPYTPYASGSPFLMPHRFNGLGVYDKLRTVQDAKTSILRQMLDNQNHANNSRCILLRDMVDMDSFTNSRPGGGVLADSPDAVVPFPFTDIGPSAQNALDYMDKVRSERGGASLDLVTAEAQIAGDTAHGVERQMTAKEQLAAMMTRTLADTLIRTTYAMVHQALRLYVPDEVQFRSGGKFITVNPAEWKERDRLTVKAGLSVAERQNKRAQLQTIIGRQDYLYTNGGDGTLVTEDQIYNSTLDWCRAGGVDNPERYFTDPGSDEAKEAAQLKRQQQQEQQAYQERLLQLQAQIEERKANNDDAKVFEDARQHDTQLQFDVWKVNQEQQTKEAEIATDTALELLKHEQADTGESADEKQAAGAAAG